ncbi:MAG: DUF3089 domain-containing protein [Pseudomonadota bacterium]
MWSRLLKLTVAFCIFVAADRAYAETDSTGLGKPLDYSDDTLWVSLPSRKDEAAYTWPDGVRQTDLDVAVFFVYPTTDLTGHVSNATLAQERADTTVNVDDMQSLASAFTPCCKLYAPYYREASIDSFVPSDPEAGDAAIEFAYRDVADAFESFLERIGDDQDFVLAGHSQGTTHLYRLLLERVIGQPVEQNFVVGYLPGMPIPQDTPLTPCKDDGETGCILVWNLFLDGASPSETMKEIPLFVDGKMNRDGHDPFLCNPPKPDTADGYTAYARKFGTALVASDGACTDGVLKIARPKEEWLTAVQIAPGWLHVYDIPVTWFAIGQDLERRYASWVGGR